MARAWRHFVPGLIWHITHRCHKRDFLLKFSRDRHRWLRWLFEAKKRYGLCVLNFALTSNHIHLLVYDHANPSVIPASMKLVAGRTAQEYNLRKCRSGAFWEDRYHATAIESGLHLLRCMIYIDLNMIRARVVSHPREWTACGYNEIMSPRERYTLIDERALLFLLEMESRHSLITSYKQWIDDALPLGELKREACWTESIAVGSRGFVEKTVRSFGMKSRIEEMTKGADPAEAHKEPGPYRAVFGSKNRLLNGLSG